MSVTGHAVHEAANLWGERKEGTDGSVHSCPSKDFWPKAKYKQIHRQKKKNVPHIHRHPCLRVMSTRMFAIFPPLSRYPQHSALLWGLDHTFGLSLLLWALSFPTVPTRFKPVLPTQTPPLGSHECLQPEGHRQCAKLYNIYIYIYGYTLHIYIYTDIHTHLNMPISTLRTSPSRHCSDYKTIPMRRRSFDIWVLETPGCLWFANWPNWWHVVNVQPCDWENPQPISAPFRHPNFNHRSW